MNKIATLVRFTVIVSFIAFCASVSIAQVSAPTPVTRARTPEGQVSLFLNSFKSLEITWMECGAPIVRRDGSRLVPCSPADDPWKSDRVIKLSVSSLESPEVPLKAGRATIYKPVTKGSITLTYHGFSRDPFQKWRRAAEAGQESARTITIKAYDVDKRLLYEIVVPDAFIYKYHQTLPDLKAKDFDIIVTAEIFYNSLEFR
jgi:hypothetical protein